jgi:hypothetical protein
MWDIPFKLMFKRVNNLSDARFAAAASADYISYNFDERSPERLSAGMIKELSQWVVGSELILEPGTQSAEEAKDVLHVLKLDGLLLNEDHLSDKDFVQFPFLLNWTDPSRMPQVQTLRAFQNLRAILLPSSSPDQWFDNAFGNMPHFIELEHFSEQTADWLITHKPYGICLAGESEDKPGNRDFSDLNDFLYLLEEKCANN